MTREPVSKTGKSPARPAAPSPSNPKNDSENGGSLQVKEDDRTNESELPSGKPFDQREQRIGKSFLGDSETPFTGFMEERQNGKRTRLVSFTNGLRDGVEYAFDSNGFVVQEANYSEDCLDGKQIFWWPNGAKKEERVWVKGKPHTREFRRWDQDGRLVEQKIDGSF